MQQNEPQQSKLGDPPSNSDLPLSRIGADQTKQSKEGDAAEPIANNHSI